MKVIKKICISVIALILAVSFSIVCTMAYFVNNSDSITESVSFSDLSINFTTGFTGNQEDGSWLIENKEKKTKQLINYSPSVTNTNEKEILPIIFISFPRYQATQKGELQEVFAIPEYVNEPYIDENGNKKYNNIQNINTTDWCLIDCYDFYDSTRIIYCYGYKNYLQPGQTTTPLCKYITNVPYFEKYDGFSHQPQDALTSFDICTYGVGCQNCETFVRFFSYGEYFSVSENYTECYKLIVECGLFIEYSSFENMIKQGITS